MEHDDEPFWLTKSLVQMSHEEWESLCDGCGRCCLIKLIEDNDENNGENQGDRPAQSDDGEVHYTDVACRLLDLKTCRCSSYDCRTQLVPDCVALTPETIARIDWLPPTCGYRLVAEGRDLPWWHPLVSGTLQTVQDAGVSVRGRVLSEEHLGEDDIEGHIVSWPISIPE